MKVSSRIWFPIAVLSILTAGIIGAATPPKKGRPQKKAMPPDTVLYTADAYRLNRKLDLETIRIADSLLDAGEDLAAQAADTVKRLTARDTIKPPEELRWSDPFRFKYYVALVDSATHVLVRDSLRHTSDSLRKSANVLWDKYIAVSDSLGQNEARPDSMIYAAEDLRARMDSLDWRKIDSIYFADSAAVAKAAFEAWYNSLSPKERRKYDKEKMLPIKMHIADSIRRAKEDAKAKKDSIIKATPRVIESFALPDSMYFSRMVVWNTEPEFHQIRPVHYDTTFNYRFHDYPWKHKDVNANWLGVSGSPVQYYNFLNRQGDEGVDFYNALEPWSYNVRTVQHFNTKVPYTELCYFGTLLAADAKESDNLHIFTTQNITPALNFSLMFDRFGGGGMLDNEITKNKNSVVDVNYMGKRYMMNAGFIHHNVSREENGGVADRMWVRDTTVEAREMPVTLSDASSSTKKNTFYLEQQLSIPFNFIYEMRARHDTTFYFNADSLDKDLTTAFIGHSSEYSTYSRLYKDNIPTSNKIARAFYNDSFRLNPTSSYDSLGVRKLENRVFVRFQPWSSHSLISKVEGGIGDRYLQYFDSTSLRPAKHVENSVFLYAGAEGKFLGFLNWDAKADYTLLGYNFGDLGIEGNADMHFYPFRKARRSPLSVSAHFETTLREPNYYQKVMNVNHFGWDNDFGKISTTKIRGNVSVPHWGTAVDVGYSLLANNVYYDSLGIARQNAKAMSVLSAALTKNFAIGPLHLDNTALLQFSSRQDIVPVPTLALNARWYFQFVVQWDESKTNKVMEMQIGADAYYNTKWYAPRYNPNIGVFYNQREELYNNGPWFDLFINIQWKRACLFIKYQNAGKGWPMKKFDYFSSDRYIITQNGTDGLKIGLYWPFYTEPGTGKSGGGSSSKGGRR